jgi:hypothetical protein
MMFRLGLALLLSVGLALLLAWGWFSSDERTAAAAVSLSSTESAGEPAMPAR